jgi:hypothetical protein
MTKARPVWVLREEIGGKVLYIIKKTSQDGLPPEAITEKSIYDNWHSNGDHVMQT